MELLKQNWLHGEIDINKPNGALLFGAVQCFARVYFEKWSDTEAKQCWHDFAILIDCFITRFSETTQINNPITIILNLPLLKAKLAKEYEVFLEKWNPKFEIITPFAQHYLYKNQFEKGIFSIRRSYFAPIPLENVLAALFILKQASCGNVSAVIDMYSVVSSKQALELQLITDPVKKSIQASQVDRKKPLAKLIEHILKENPNYSNNAIFKRLNNQSEEDKNICRIKSAVCGKKGFIEYYKNSKSKTTEPPVSYRNFISSISKARKRI